MPESTIENGSHADRLATIAARLTTEDLRVLVEAAREMREQDAPGQQS